MLSVRYLSVCLSVCPVLSCLSCLSVTFVHCGLLGVEVGLGPVHIVLDGDAAPLPKKGAESPNFRPIFIVAKRWMHQNATWYGGRPQPRRHCVQCGPSYPQKKRHTHLHPIFGPCLLWPNSWMDEHAAWYGSRPRPRPHSI